MLWFPTCIILKNLFVNALLNRDTDVSFVQEIPRVSYGVIKEIPRISYCVIKEIPSQLWL